MCSTISKDTIYCNSGIMLNYVETNIWVDGNPMDLGKCDGLIYIMESSKYYVLTDFLAGHSLNAKIFGAKGDGITDDTIAIQQMMDFAWKIRDVGIYTNIYFPRGRYKLTHMIQAPNRVSISGDGINASVIFTENDHDMLHFREEKDTHNADRLLRDENGNLVLDQNGNTIIDKTNNLYTKISNISFYGINHNGLVSTANSIAGNNGLVFMDMVKVELDSVSLRGFLQCGLYFHKVYYIKLKNVNAEYNRKGLVASECTSLESLNCEFRLNGQGVYLYKTYAFSFINPLIESNMWAIDNNAINYDLNPAEKSSIGILLYQSWNGSIFGGYFENQLVSIYYYGSSNINVGNSFFCNDSVSQRSTSTSIFMPPYFIYMINSHENEIYGNSYAIDISEVPDVQRMQMYIAPNSHNNLIKINKREDFNSWKDANSWIFEEFQNNGISEKSPRVMCESSDVEYLHGKFKTISGVFYGTSSEKPLNPKIGQLYFNTTNAKIEFFYGVNWIIT